MWRAFLEKSRRASNAFTEEMPWAQGYYCLIRTTDCVILKALPLDGSSYVEWA
jgi:hypothetical protein